MVEFTRTLVTVDPLDYWSTQVYAFVGCASTSWIGRNFELSPGRWFARVSSYDPDDAEGTPRYSNVISFRVRYWPKRKVRLRSIHPGAVPAGYTYNGDTVAASFRDLHGHGRSTRYRVCYRANWRDVCTRKRSRGIRWSSWRVHILPPWAGFNNGRYTRRVVFRWYAGGKLVGKNSLVVWE